MSIYDEETGQAFKVGFFQRLSNQAPHTRHWVAPDLADVVASIQANVLNLFNARRGHSQSAPDLGLIDFNDATAGSRDLNLRIKLAIKKLIAEYEPRIHQLDVAIERQPNDPLMLSFHLTGTLNLSDEQSQIKLGFILDGNRRYRAMQ